MAHHVVCFAVILIPNESGVGILAAGVTQVSLTNVSSSNHGTSGIEISGNGYSLKGSVIENTGCVGVKVTVLNIES